MQCSLQTARSCGADGAFVSELSEEAQSKTTGAEQARARWRTWLGRELLKAAGKAGAAPRGRRASTRSLLLVLQSRWSLRLGLTECIL